MPGLLAWLPLLSSFILCAMANAAPPDVVQQLAPTGTLRAAINYGNSVLAQKDPTTGEPRGVSADLARELAGQLGVPVVFVTFDAAGKGLSTAAAASAGIAFLPGGSARPPPVPVSHPLSILL